MTKQQQLHFFVLLALFLAPAIQGLENGLARTPPMGWLSWERFMCNTNCKRDPDNCLSEKLIKQQADEMVKQGFLEAGYEYIIIDDCWPDMVRDPKTGKLQSDPERFPSGLKALGDYVHKLGLKYGIYEDYGNKTCGGYPGVLQNMKLDAQTLAEWGADYIKLDGCYANVSLMAEGYPEFGKYLNETGRPIVYSCSWPAYQQNPDYKSIAKHCNLWRNWADIGDSWESVKSIILWFAKHQDSFTEVSGPGHWNDPDMIIVGNFGLSYDQSKVQLAVWAIMAAPLIMSNDLRNLKSEHKDLLLNKGVIKINQDPMGIQGKRVRIENNNLHIFVRPILPSYKGNMSAAVALVNMYAMGSGYLISFTPRSIGLEHSNGYRMTDVFEKKFLKNVMPDDYIELLVNPTGVQFLRFDVKPSNSWNHEEQVTDENSFVEVSNPSLSGIIEFPGLIKKPTVTNQCPII